MTFTIRFYFPLIMKNLEQAILKLSGYIPQFELKNPEVSHASVGWHIAHSHLVINSVIESLKNSNPSEYKWKFSLLHLYVLIKGGFPRGKGKAPEKVIPREVINIQILKRSSDETQTALAKIPQLPENAYFKHPLFGLLNKKSTIRFLEIHTNHHLKIIKDILG